MESSRIARVLRLLYLITRGDRSTSDQLANTLGCSKRTLYRDFKLLEDHGFRRLPQLDGGGDVAKTHESIIQSITDEEIAALLIAIKIAPIWDVAPFASDLRLAFTKLLEHCPERQKARIETLLSMLQPASREVKSGLYDQGRFWQIVDAITQRRTAELSWRPGDSQHWYTFRFLAVGLRLGSEGWLVVGQSELHQQIVALSISNIRHVKVLADCHFVSNEWNQRSLEVDPPPPHYPAQPRESRPHA